MLVEMKIKEFLDELASDSPAPGGGSAAALSGAVGAGLLSMVSNLTIGKKKYLDVDEEIKKIRDETKKIRGVLRELIDRDTKSFNKVMDAFGMPKESDREKWERREAIQKAFKGAALVPMETAENSLEILRISKRVAEIGNQNSITDVGVAALMADSGFKGAVFNVRINLGSIKDKEFCEETENRLSELEMEEKELIATVLRDVEERIK